MRGTEGAVVAGAGSGVRSAVVAALRRPVVQDVLIATAVAILSLASLWNPSAVVDHDFRDPDGLGVALSLLGAVAIVGRRREPFAAWCVALASCLLLAQLGYGQTLGGLPALLTLYTVAVRQRFALSLAVALTTIVAIGVVLRTGPIEPSTGDWIANTLVLTLGWSFGRSVQSRRTRIASLDARDEAVAAAESAHRHWVELQRRAELAQELQDLVAHNLTQITVQMAGARRMVDHDPALAKSTLGQAEEAGRAAMHEMRRLFDVLKASDASAQLTPAPGLGDLPRLASSKREAGVDVVVTTEGTLDHVPGSVGLTVYRVVEETLVNAEQHASARAVHVDLSCSSDLLRLKVVNSGNHATPRWMHDPGPADGDDRVGAGGLRRLQSRLALFGGHMTWDRRRDGGFVVEVEVPITPLEGTP